MLHTALAVPRINVRKLRQFRTLVVALLALSGFLPSQIVIEYYAV